MSQLVPFQVKVQKQSTGSPLIDVVHAPICTSPTKLPGSGGKLSSQQLYVPLLDELLPLGSLLEGNELEGLLELLPDGSLLDGLLELLEGNELEGLLELLPLGSLLEGSELEGNELLGLLELLPDGSLLDGLLDEEDELLLDEEDDDELLLDEGSAQQQFHHPIYYSQASTDVSGSHFAWMM